VSVAPPGLCNRGGSRGSRVRSPPVPVVLSVYQRGSLLDGLAMYLSCDTKKFHDNENTYYIIFGRPPIGGKLSPFPLGGATGKCRTCTYTRNPTADVPRCVSQYLVNCRKRVETCCSRNPQQIAVRGLRFTN